MNRTREGLFRLFVIAWLTILSAVSVVHSKYHDDKLPILDTIRLHTVEEREA